MMEIGLRIETSFVSIPRLALRSELAAQSEEQRAVAVTKASIRLISVITSDHFMRFCEFDYDRT